MIIDNLREVYMDLLYRIRATGSTIVAGTHKQEQDARNAMKSALEQAYDLGKKENEQKHLNVHLERLQVATRREHEENNL